MVAIEREMKVFATQQYRREGWGPFLRLTLPRSKKRAFKELGPLDREALERQLRRRDFGLAMILGAGLVVLDKDGPNQGPFAELRSPMTSETERGEHLFFQTAQEMTNKIKAMRYDVDILFHGIVCVPPSEMATGKERIWKTGIVRFADLPTFPLELLQALKRSEPKRTFRHELVPPSSAKIDAMRRWIAGVTAESGNGGDRATYRVACKIVSVLRDDFDCAMAEILAWDRTNALPPWSDTVQGVKALEHKVRCAMKFILEKTQQRSAS